MPDTSTSVTNFHVIQGNRNMQYRPDTEIRLYDLKGKLRFRGRTDNTGVIPSKLPEGVYIVRQMIDVTRTRALDHGNL